MMQDKRSMPNMAKVGEKKFKLIIMNFKLLLKLADKILVV